MNEVSVARLTGENDAAALRRALEEGKPFVLAVPQAAAVTDALQALLLKPFADGKVVMTYGRLLPDAGTDRLCAGFLAADFPEEPEIRDMKTVYRRGPGAYLSVYGAVMYRASAFFEAGFPEADTILPFSTLFAARVLFMGLHAVYVPEAEVRVTGKASVRTARREAFRTGMAMKRDIQVYGFNVPLHPARIPGDETPVIWPDAGTWLLQRADLAGRLGAGKLKRVFLKTAVRLGYLLGNKYLYLPAGTVRRNLG